ncbi:YggS family pyridoxal phosphate-dependent enzyme [Halothermothrix orenii]|uniref:Pyridoxal phosphate homeostasis protein n=1 Tax=Halothermothrix orenii (strain H 168 / OCM 544 / DSM 9562) TaxID=373903 RepID=B8CWK9_HALOH|nr:YggS family pyridoxal phosphate-dependent enzyme [Halothermothrix orenii]ACL69678.1 conserved hypothetical protein TIGR00044 [Halothermothrix orenii H 168]
MVTKDLQTRLEEINKRIDDATRRSGRKDKVKLLPVSKGQSPEKIKYFQRQGFTIFGESRVQELREKDEKLDGVEWHFIGHLQRNKVKYLMRMENCTLIHSLDSWRLARTIDKRARKNNRKIPVLVQVNVARDPNKFGIEPSEVKDFVYEVSKLENIRVEGLMTIVPYSENPEEARPYFKQMNNLKNMLCDKGFNVKELSMGMSNDFEVAIEEGATIIRIGTKLFGERVYN